MIQKEIFGELWELKESYMRFQKQFADFVGKLFPVGSRISFNVHGNVRTGIVKRLCTEGNILFTDDKGKEGRINIFYLIERFYWDEIFPDEAKPKYGVKMMLKVA